MSIFFFFQAFNTLAHPLRQAKQMGYKLDSTVLDISHVDVSKLLRQLLLYLEYDLFSELYCSHKSSFQK